MGLAGRVRFIASVRAARTARVVVAILFVIAARATCSGRKYDHVILRSKLFHQGVHMVIHPPGESFLSGAGTEASTTSKSKWESGLRRLLKTRENARPRRP